MFNGNVIGIIAGGKLRPTKTKQLKIRNGEEREVFFCRFNMWVDDLTKPAKEDEQGRKQRQRSLLHVILPENENQHRVFDFLEPGRKVMVKGDITHRPNFTTTNGQIQVYANPTMHVGSRDVQLLDTPFRVTGERVVNFLKKNEQISEEQADMLVSFIKEYFNDSEREKPRIYEDHTSSNRDKENDQDPDKPGF